MNSRNRIFQYVFESESAITKQDLVTELQLSLPTVTNNMNALIDEGLLMLVGSDESVVSVGRKPQLITINPQARYTIGVSIKPSLVHIVAVDLKKNVVAKQIRNIDFHNTSEYFSQLITFVYRFIQLSEIEFTSVLGIGIAFPGIIDRSEMRIVSSVELNIENELIAKSFKKTLFPIWIENDAIASGRYSRQRADCSANFLFLSIDTYIKAALFINGEPYGGNGNHGVDIAHICLVPGGKECYCGQSGCIERYLSLTNISENFGTDLGSFISGMENGNTLKLSRNTKNGLNLQF